MGQNWHKITATSQTDRKPQQASDHILVRPHLLHHRGTHLPLRCMHCMKRGILTLNTTSCSTDPLPPNLLMVSHETDASHTPNSPQLLTLTQHRHQEFSLVRLQIYNTLLHNPNLGHHVLCVLVAPILRKTPSSSKCQAISKAKIGSLPHKAHLQSATPPCRVPGCLCRQQAQSRRPILRALRLEVHAFTQHNFQHPKRQPLLK